MSGLLLIRSATALFDPPNSAADDILQAHRLSQPDMTHSAATTTTPDDVFYILKVVLLRLLSTGSLNVTDRMIEKLRDILEKDHAGVLKRKMDDVYRTAGAPG